MSRWTLRTRLALGLSPMPWPGLVPLPLGIALGPHHGLGVLTDPVLAALSPGVSVALAALGVYVGMGLNFRRPREGVLLAAASLEAGLTILAVGAGALALQALSPGFGTVSWLPALMLGICASASSTAAGSDDRPASPVTRVGDLDDVLPIVVGGIALAALRQPLPAAVALLTAQAALVALGIATAGGLLVRQTASESEQRVFTIGALLLLGGAAAYLSLSALFFGLVAGAFWSAGGSVARQSIARDMRYLQHPLIVLLLLVAGARLDVSTDLVRPALAYAVCRVAGKLLGGWLAGRTLARDLPSGLGFYLLSPGAVGLAFALNALQARAGTSPVAMLFTIVMMGTLASEAVWLVVGRREEPA